MITEKDLPDNVRNLILEDLIVAHLGKALSKYKIECQEDFDKAMDSMKCTDCSDYQDKLCPGQNLTGPYVFNCITDLSRIMFGGNIFDDDNDKKLVPGKSRKAKKRGRRK